MATDLPTKLLLWPHKMVILVLVLFSMVMLFFRDLFLICVYV